jgi:DNA-binding transcriptional LysR family regulator
MNLVQIKYFREVVICGSVTEAAKRLAVTQPAVSKQMRLLEQEFECEVFVKRGRKMRLTEAGRIIFNRAELLLEQYDLLKKDIADFNSSGQLKGKITIGCGPLLSRSVMPDFTVDFMRRYPDISLSIYETDSAVLPELLVDGMIDIGLGAGNFAKSEDIRFQRLFCGDYVIIHSSRIVIPGELFPIEQIANYSLINHMPGSIVYSFAMKKLKLKHEQTVLYARNTETIIEFVKRGVGIAFVPLYLIKIIKPEGILWKRLTVPARQDVGIYYMPENIGSQVQKIFCAAVKDWFNKLGLGE